MNLKILKLILLTSIFLLASCDITFKRASESATGFKTVPSEEQQANKALTKEEQKQRKRWKNDFLIIKSYYADVENRTIRKDMLSHTTISKKQEKNLVAGKTVPRDVQVMPLPMILERKLSTLPLDIIRVQVGTHVVLMKVKSRQIIDVVKI